MLVVIYQGASVEVHVHSSGSNSHAKLSIEGSGEGKVKVTARAGKRHVSSLQKLRDAKKAKRTKSTDEPDFGKFSLKRRFNKDQVLRTPVVIRSCATLTPLLCNSFVLPSREPLLCQCCLQCLASRR